ncbi:nuclear transport factor 2 family protein [Marivita sp. S6314]|uniref:ketosteroid isomerase-related protein n=1 Tax=Marivita sp. S6314 TaxID=2926406 RepID=UPI001FF396B3|nr:ketosteroid isomerase-related protein [Marivita sp. S6314]MCK0149063.1 nuclear transport factor 2 family protein [Marivita sp. S6314]
MTRATIERYFDAFNRKDIAGMVDCLSDDIAHHVNEGDVRIGREAFEAFCQHMARCYDETLTELVIFDAEDGTRGAAEFMVNGTYLESDAGLPPATGQGYRLPAGSFFSMRDGKITRVVTYYNLSDWIKQVS